MNKLWPGVHWAKRKKWRDEGHKACRVIQCDPINHPVKLIFTPVLSGRKRGYDCSNYAVTAKVIEDALVEKGILTDDTNKYVRSVTLNAPVRGDETGMEVEIVAV